MDRNRQKEEEMERTYSILKNGTRVATQQGEDARDAVARFKVENGLGGSMWVFVGEAEIKNLESGSVYAAERQS